MYQLSLAIKKAMLLLFLGLLLDSPVQAKNFNKRFRQAETLFDSGNLTKAGNILIRLTKDFPKRDDAWQLLAQIYFSRGDFKNARRAFDQINPRSLSRKVAYAWGASYYSSKQWKKAIYGFRKVARDDRYRNLSAYYLGVCYYRINNLFGARKMLLRSDDDGLLPVMRKNKAEILRIVEEKRDNEIARVINGESLGRSNRGISSGIIVLQSVASVPTPSSSSGIVEDAAKSEDKKSWLMKPHFKVNQVNLSYENHGFNTDEQQNLVHEEGLTAQYLSNGGRTRQTFGLIANVGYGGVDQDFSTSRFVSLQDTTGAFTQRSSSSSSESYVLASAKPIYVFSGEESKFELGLNLSYNLGQNVGDTDWGHALLISTYKGNFNRVAINLAAYGGQKFDNDQDQEMTEFKITSNISWNFSNFSLGFETRLVDRYDFVHTSSKSSRFHFVDGFIEGSDGYGRIVDMRLRSSVNFGDLRLGVLGQEVRRSLSVEEKARNGGTGSLDGFSTSTMKGEVTVSYPIIEGFTILGSGQYKFFDSYLSRFADSAGNEATYQADAEQLGGAIALVAQPLSWISLSARMDTADITYTPRNFTMNNQYQINNPDFFSNSEFLMNVFYEF